MLSRDLRGVNRRRKRKRPAESPVPSLDAMVLILFDFVREPLLAANSQGIVVDV
jgi:hypothetical protein